MLPFGSLLWGSICISPFAWHRSRRPNSCSFYCFQAQGLFMGRITADLPETIEKRFKPARFDLEFWLCCMKKKRFTIIRSLGPEKSRSWPASRACLNPI
jgi:hypothetical protein